MTKQDAKKRIEKLREEINKYRYSYHVLDKSLISDAALDSLKKKLFDLEQQFPDLITPDSPTQRVGGKPLKEFKKVVREGRRRMNSLEDAFSEDDMRAWFERLENYLRAQTNAEQTPTYADIFRRKSASSLPRYRSGEAGPRKSAFYCDLKMDGLAVELVYKNGVLAQGSTRGDGFVGEDITHNLKTIEAIPLRLEGKEIPPEFIVRGEVFITKKEFARMNREQKEKGGKPYANPRNVAAGSIRQLDPKVAAARKLDFFAYGVVEREVRGRIDEEYMEKYPGRSAEYEALNRFGIKTNPHGRVIKTFPEIFKFHEEVKRMREKLPYEIDGIVVTVDDNRIYAEAGIIGKAPRASIAYKFSPREAATVVENIEVQVGRTGALTPVAVMKPVNVGGVTITHATLHNEDEIRRLGLKIGDTVIVNRAGDVIPQVTKVLKDLRIGKEKEFRMPARCPIDGSKVVKEGAIHRCSNPRCGARHRESLYHFVSGGAFNIEGLGPKIIDHFLDEGLIADAADIFTLKEGDIAALPRFGEKSAANIVKEIEERKEITLPRFIFSLGILHVGEETANLLAYEAAKSRCIERPADLLNAVKEFSLERLQEIPDVGPKVAQSIYGWFREPRNTKFMEKLDKVGVQIERLALSLSKGQKLAGKTFVLTGTLESLGREAAKEKIREQGGDVSESVSKKTDYVVIGSEPGSKFEKAKRLGVKVVDEAEFLGLLR